MWTDPIIAEVRKAREEYAKKFGYNLDRIFSDLKKSEKKRLAASGRDKTKKAIAIKSKTPTAKRRKAA